MGRHMASHGNLLAIVLGGAIFLNGFEAGGYQACLLSIGQEFALTDALMGLLASVQLVATLVAPFILGPLADRHGKKGFLVVFLASEAVSAILVGMATGVWSFVAGIFVVGFCTSIVQYISLAALADAYPRTSGRRFGTITAFYSLGAFAAPLICGALISAGISWRVFFAVLAVCAVIVVAIAILVDFSPRERVLVADAGAALGGGVVQGGDAGPGGEGIGPRGSVSAGVGGDRVLWGIVALCFIMFIYVGLESGIGFFLNAFVQTELGGGVSYAALSLFWLAMIPSRLLCGLLGGHGKVLLLVATTGAAISTFLMSAVSCAPVALVLAFVLGFFCGAVYPCVLDYMPRFSGGRTATVTGAITAATGLGGAVIAAGFGWMSGAFGMRLAFVALGCLALLDVAAALLLMIRTRR